MSLNPGNFILLGIGFEILVLLAFLMLRWLDLPVGSLLDWVIGGASFWWLLVIVTVPWNLYFRAKEVLADAQYSSEQGISVNPKQMAYARLLSRRSLLVAIALHLISALGLYTLSATGVTPVGYLGAAAALLLTGLRPAVRAYDYLASRLSLIQQELKYPREDVVELRQRLTTLETTVKQLEEQLNPEAVGSWATTQEKSLEDLRQTLSRLATTLEDLRVQNQAEHLQLSREASQAIAQLSADGQFLEHVREIIRFFKSA